jgi:hypothetical protein
MKRRLSKMWKQGGCQFWGLQKNNGIIFVFDEGGFKQPCKLASKNEVWKIMWPLGFVGPCTDLIIVNICAFLIQFAHMKDIFVCDLVVVIEVYQGDLYMYCE